MTASKGHIAELTDNYLNVSIYLKDFNDHLFFYYNKDLRMLVYKIHIYKQTIGFCLLKIETIFNDFPNIHVDDNFYRRFDNELYNFTNRNRIVKLFKDYGINIEIKDKPTFRPNYSVHYNVKYTIENSLFGEEFI